MLYTLVLYISAPEHPPLSVAQSHCPQLVPECEVIKDKFEPLFALFARCHTMYDATSVNQLQELRMYTVHYMHDTHTRIILHSTSFLLYYRLVFPDASITVKMHLLEDHMGGMELVLG